MTKEQARLIGRMLATARRKKGWSLRRLAYETGMSHVWLLKVERGESLNPPAGRLILVADVLDVDPERIERVARGQITDSLPSVRAYFRAKYELTPDEIAEIERTVNDIQGKHERRHEP